MSDLVQIIWDTEKASFKVSGHFFLMKSKFEPGQLVDVTPIGPLLTARGVIEPMREVLDKADKYRNQGVNAYELTMSASDVEPQEYSPVVNAYTFKLYRIRPQPSTESSPELLDHIRSIQAEARSNEDHHQYD